MKKLFGLKINKDDIILDVGCWDGYKVKQLNKKCFAVGIDINKEKLLSGISKNLVCADALNLPFKKNVFTKVICTELIEHVNDDEKVLEEIRRVLNHNGELLLSAPRKIIWFNFWDPAYIKWKIFNSNYIHRHYSIKDLVKKLNKYNFYIERLKILGSYIWIFNRWFHVILKHVLKGKVRVDRLTKELNRLWYKEFKTKKGNFNIFILAKVNK